MLSKALQTLNRTQVNSLTAFASRGVYAKGKEPFVFINQHTKVLVQGMTGKHVSPLFSNVLAGHVPHKAGA